MQNLVAELKRDRDEEFQNSIDQLASELNHVSMTTASSVTVVSIHDLIAVY
jgi:hypothetical protein